MGRRETEEPGTDPSRDDEVRPDADAPSLASDPRRIVQTVLGVLLAAIAIYVLVPRVVGLEDAIGQLSEGQPIWIATAVLFTIGAFGAYVALFRGVVGERVTALSWAESYQITMAGLAATRLFSAGGAGGIVLTYWALRKAGMARRQSAARMVCFLVLLYSVYLTTVVVCGVLLRSGVLAGPAPAGLTVVPAAIAGGVILVVLLISLVPGDLERRLSAARKDSLSGRLTHRLATVPATLGTGIRTAIAFVREPSRGGLAMLGAIGFWAANIGILWASFRAFGVDVDGAVIVQGFFVGMSANLIPFAPGGVGAVDAGMIGTFVLFGLPGAPVFAAVLTYRLIAFWLPIPPGVVAFLQLRSTVSRWEREGRPVEEWENERPEMGTSQTEVT